MANRGPPRAPTSAPSAVVAVVSPHVPDAVAMSPADGDAAVVVAAVPRLNIVAMSQVAREHLEVTPAASDQLTTSPRLVAGPTCAPDAIATRSAAGGAVAAVKTAPWSQVAVAISLDAGQQLTSSPVAGDHVATTSRPWNAITASPCAPDAVATRSATGGAASAPTRPPRKPGSPAQ